MSLTLGQFYNSVSAELRRGTALDTLIPARVRQALKWMESQHTFLHMEHYASLALTIGQRSYAPPAGFKRMRSWRGLLADNATSSSYFNIKKIDSYDVSRVERHRPNGYWQDGKNYFWLDNIPDQDYDTELDYDGYTVLSDNLDTTPVVLDLYEGLLLNAAVVLFAPQLRDATVKALYQSARDEFMKAAIDADVEERQSWQSESVQYGYEFREEINERGDSQP